MKTIKKHKVIIDTDPGVDDATSIIFSLFDPNLDIKLFTVPAGNVPVDVACRNVCHFLDLFDKDYPVVKGHKTAMKRVSKDATFLHGKEGLGGYIPPKTTKHKPEKIDVADAMYKVIKENPHEISILMLGPQTNLGRLLEKYPDAENLIKEVIFEGAAPFGLPNNPDYVSFNARTDPEALKLVLDSKIPVVMVPSTMGRFVTHLNEEQVERISKTNDVGKFMAKTFEIYWEPSAPDKRIATNDTCALFYLEKPKMYRVKKCNCGVNVTTVPGDLDVHYTRRGHIKIVLDIDRKKFDKIFFDKLESLNDVKLDEKIYDLTKKQGKMISARESGIIE